jgi:hypothetical protein
MSADVRDMSKAALLKELRDLGAQFQKTLKALTDEGGAAGSPCEWMDERADEIRTELRSRARWRQ